MATNSTPELVQYGIQNEQSDVRAHVCPLVRRVYVYPTSEGRRAVESGNWPKRQGFQRGVVGHTAEGYLVPPSAIPRCLAIAVRDVAWDAVDFRESDTTSAKGKKATRLVAEMVRAGIFPIPLAVENLNAAPPRHLEIDGDDIIVDFGAGRVRIQVKCDYRGGDVALGGTGNLFLQVAERNPLKRV